MADETPAIEKPDAVLRYQTDPVFHAAVHQVLQAEGDRERIVEILHRLSLEPPAGARTCEECGRTWYERSPGAVGCPYCFQARRGGGVEAAQWERAIKACADFVTGSAEIGSVPERVAKLARYVLSLPGAPGLRPSAPDLLYALREAEAGLEFAISSLRGGRTDWDNSSPRKALRTVKEALSGAPVERDTAELMPPVSQLYRHADGSWTFRRHVERTNEFRDSPRQIQDVQELRFALLQEAENGPESTRESTRDAEG